MIRRRIAITLCASAAAAALSCSGMVGQEGAPAGEGASDVPGGGGVRPAEMRPTAAAPKPSDGANARTPTGDPGALPPARVRRLSAVEIANSLRDIFPMSASIAIELPTEKVMRGFDNRIEALGISLPFVEALQTTAEEVGAAVVAKLGAVVSCDFAADALRCAGQFVDAYAPRLYRRPLAPDERASLLTVFQEARRGGNAGPAVGAVVEAMIQSPNFLFRTELGSPAAPGGRTASLTPFELASALSYFLWSSTPDAPLLEAAAAGRLGSKAELAAQARRMLMAPRAKESLRRFVTQWLEIEGIDKLTKEGGWNAGLASAAQQEVSAFVDDAIWSGDGSLRALLTSPNGFVNKELAALYGAPAPARATGLQPVRFDPAARPGLLSRVGFLAAHTPPAAFSPIDLGRLVRTKLLCQTLPAPPPNIPPAPQPSKTVSSRQRFASHRDDQACRGCHALMDPIGFGFERFDVVGRQVDKENGTVPLTGDGELVGTDVDGPFRGVAALVDKLLASAEVRRCVAAQLSELASGRVTASPRDRSAAADPIAAAASATLGAGGGLKELAVALVTTDAFLARDVSALTIGGSP